MKLLVFAFLISLPTVLYPQENKISLINEFADEWHTDAANADMEAYFDKIDEDGVFIGTDATENWTKAAFYEWAKPYFNDGKAWTFEAFERNIYLSKDGTLAWFDEKLRSSSGELRGSGVIKIDGETLKIMHYVLSVPVPNDEYKEVMEVISGEK